ncbi:hypothetical protein BR93DRAFT_291272 [Coniochaeta sp. PMI_546]|nr:hypothetical protein BR93DRAFT_291272 [Coniochaeta sp. PMI_546]
MCSLFYNCATLLGSMVLLYGSYEVLQALLCSAPPCHLKCQGPGDSQSTKRRPERQERTNWHLIVQQQVFEASDLPPCHQDHGTILRQ